MISLFTHIKYTSMNEIGLNPNIPLWSEQTMREEIKELHMKVYILVTSPHISNCVRFLNKLITHVSGKPHSTRKYRTTQEDTHCKSRECRAAEKEQTRRSELGVILLYFLFIYLINSSNTISLNLHIYAQNYTIHSIMSGVQL